LEFEEIVAGMGKAIWGKFGEGREQLGCYIRV
jgi:hypothetical protein